MPHAPEHSAAIGLAYSWFFAPGTLTARWDYHWQAENFVSVFNSPQDKIDSWSQHNASLIFESANNRWSAKLWIRNIADKDHLIDKYARRQLVFSEPRIFGASFRYNFGAQ